MHFSHNYRFPIYENKQGNKNTTSSDNQYIQWIANIWVKWLQLCYYLVHWVCQAWQCRQTRGRAVAPARWWSHTLAVPTSSFVSAPAALQQGYQTHRQRSTPRHSQHSQYWNKHIIIMNLVVLIPNSLCLCCLSVCLYLSVCLSLSHTHTNIITIFYLLI